MSKKPAAAESAQTFTPTLPSDGIFMRVYKGLKFALTNTPSSKLRSAAAIFVWLREIYC